MMRALPVIFLFLIGAFFILARNFYARFVMSLVYEIPAVRKREKTILQATSAISACFGAGFIVLSLLMALNLVFPW